MSVTGANSECKVKGHHRFTVYRALAYVSRNDVLLLMLLPSPPHSTRSSALPFQPLLSICSPYWRNWILMRVNRQTHKETHKDRHGTTLASFITTATVSIDVPANSSGNWRVDLR